MSLGIFPKGLAMPVPDMDNTTNILAATVKRIASKHPTPDPVVMEKFSKWIVQVFLPREFPNILDPEVDLSIENWLNNTNYPEWRKQELRQTALKYKTLSDDPNFTKVKAFIKDESYEKLNYPRGIFSRSDSFKLAFGPLVKQIEKLVYSHPAFVKHVPVVDRPRFIMERVYRDNIMLYFATDFTAFESQFRRELMEVCENAMFKYFTQRLTDTQKERIAFMTDRVIAGHNYIMFKNVSLTVEATRMSGEMSTSLSNGFSNLAFFHFVNEEILGNTGISGVVEGDDGLFSISSIKNEPDCTHFEKLGLTVKMEKHNKIEEASFCGNIFDPNELINVTNPIAMVLDMSYGSSKYAHHKNTTKMALLKSKALSMYYQFNGCPILCEYAQSVLNRLKHIDWRRIKNSRNIDWWTREMLTQLPASMPTQKIPGPRTRDLVERKFGIPVQAQIYLENLFRSQTKIEPWSDPIFNWFVPDQWKKYSHEFSNMREQLPQNSDPKDYFGYSLPGPAKYIRLAVDRKLFEIDEEDYKNLYKQQLSASSSGKNSNLHPSIPWV